MSLLANSARLWVLGLVCTIAVLLSIWNPWFLRTLETLVYDAQIVWNNRVPSPERRVVVIDIDEASIRQLGPWPWPRDRLANLLDRLTTYYDVSVIGLDIVFPDLREGDQRLKQVLERSPVVMAQAFELAPLSQNHSGQLFDNIQIQASFTFPQAKGFIGNATSLLGDRQAVGHITPVIDIDGRVRRVQPILCYQSPLVAPLCSATLGLRMYMQLNQLNVLEWRDNLIHGPHLFTSPDTGLGMPIDREGFTLIPYRLSRSDFLVFSAQDILAQQAPRDELKGSLVLIGSTALGLGDRVSTPRDHLTSGIEIHAQILSSILDRDWLTQAPVYMVWLISMTFIFFISAVLVKWVRQSHFSDALFWGLGSAFLWWFLNQSLWQISKIYVPMMFVWSFIILALLGIALLEQSYFQQRFDQMVQGVLPYLPQRLSDRVQETSFDKSHYGRSVEEAEVVVLIADIVGYTKMIQGRNSADVAALMQQFIASVGDVMRQEGGEIDKFTGDGVVVLWPSSKSMQERMQCALVAAQSLQLAVDQMQPWLLSHDFDHIQMSVGINAGFVALGSYGESRLTYTAHGDVMNVAAKLERLTRQVGKNILLSESAIRYLGSDQYQYLGAFELEGRHGAMNVYMPAAVVRTGPHSC